VNPNPPTNNPVTYTGTVAPGGSATINVGNTNNGFTYQLKNNGTDANVGSPVNSTADGSTVSLSTGSLASNTNFYVQVTDGTRPTNCTSRLSTAIFVALPVQFMYVQAERINARITLDWATAWEENNRYFEIERSTDAVRFTGIGRVEGSGTLQRMSQYAFTDSLPLVGPAYYRIKQVDENEAYSYSRVVPVSGLPDIAWEVSPNPCTDKLTVQLTSSNSLSVQAELCDIQGNLVRQLEQKTGGWHAALEFSIPDLPAGVYILKIRTDKGQMLKQIVKL